MDSFLQDLRYAWRRILGSPLYNSLIVLSLALGIGANTAIFSLANGVLLKPLPYPDGERIVAVAESNPTTSEGSPTSPPNFEDLRREARSFSHLAAWSDSRGVLLMPGTEPERVDGAAVSSGFFRVLSVPFVLGRSFTESEDHPGASRVVVIGTDLWRRRFGEDPGVLGSTVTLDEETHTIIGVVDSKLAYPENAGYWIPLALKADESMRTSRWLSLIGRLRPGVPLEQAQAELSTIGHRLEQQHPVLSRNPGFKLQPLRESIVGHLRSAFLLLIAAAAVVLLISCANVATILLSRSIAQEKEMVVRSALGCSKGRLLRLSLIEMTLLSLLGAGIALALAVAMTSILLRYAAEVLPRQGQIGIDPAVLLFTLGLALLTALLLGPAPLLRQRLGLAPAAILRTADRAAGSRSRFVLAASRVATVVEVALAVLALLSAGLLTHSFLKLIRVSPGFRADSATAVDLGLSGRDETVEQQQRLYRDLLSAVASQPGVEHAGVIFPMPLSGVQFSSKVLAEEQPLDDPEAAASASVNFISPDLLPAMGIPLVRGRGFGLRDNTRAPLVALVSQGLASKLWPGASPIGRRVAFGIHDRQWATVVGVVGDVHQRSLQEGPRLEAYRPILQVPRGEATLIVRSSAAVDSAVTAAGLRRTLHELDANLVLADFRTLRDVVARSTRRERFQSLLTGIFAALSLVLSAAGIFGVLSYGIAQRRHEIGVRMAFGASRSEILGLLAKQGLRLVVTGFLSGVVLYLLTSQALSAFLFGIGRIDPVTLLLVFALVMVIGGLAIMLPVWRAIRLDPMTAFRGE
jgi:putative ABC transport system permease protein